MNNFNRRQYREKPELPKDEFAIVLDVVLSSGNSFKDTDIVQAVGTQVYTILELVAKDGVILKTGDKVYIGDGKRDDIQYIKNVISSDKLSGSAKSELIYALIEIIKERESEFVNFFNNSGPITIRKHSLELIPGIGKKHLTHLIDERYKPFKNFEDISKRCSYISDPAKAIAQRILIEIDGEDDFKFFIRR